MIDSYNRLFFSFYLSNIEIIDQISYGNQRPVGQVGLMWPGDNSEGKEVDDFIYYFDIYIGLCKFIKLICPIFFIEC